MENFDILNFILLLIIYELVKYVFGDKNSTNKDKEHKVYVTPKYAPLRTTCLNCLDISGLKLLPSAEEDDESGDFFSCEEKMMDDMEATESNNSRRLRLNS